MTSELVTNSDNRSKACKGRGTVTVTLRVATDRALVEVIDDGGTTVPTLCRDGRPAETARGLWLVVPNRSPATIATTTITLPPGSSAYQNSSRNLG